MTILTTSLAAPLDSLQYQQPEPTRSALLYIGPIVAKFYHDTNQNGYYDGQVLPSASQLPLQLVGLPSNLHVSDPVPLFKRVPLIKHNEIEYSPKRKKAPIIDNDAIIITDSAEDDDQIEIVKGVVGDIRENIKSAPYCGENQTWDMASKECRSII
ncbi:hypothetical protein QAD02_022282 [Eretmocerus hayati]|uniref:Uncharacterized protein n=1 Tax=Eretmocerus hayati TaxID=131215 RepID=A0ACC2PU41_9HYME|nr:hypothetical protein QAD02_022282 [Eretmocerus hayati]